MLFCDGPTDGKIRLVVSDEIVTPSRKAESSNDFKKDSRQASKEHNVQHRPYDTTTGD